MKYLRQAIAALQQIRVMHAKLQVNVRDDVKLTTNSQPI